MPEHFLSARWRHWWRPIIPPFRRAALGSVESELVSLLGRPYHRKASIRCPCSRLAALQGAPRTLLFLLLLLLLLFISLLRVVMYCSLHLCHLYSHLKFNSHCDENCLQPKILLSCMLFCGCRNFAVLFLLLQNTVCCQCVVQWFSCDAIQIENLFTIIRAQSCIRGEQR